jgi:hypothetical protein
MPNKPYLLTLTAEERAELDRLTRSGRWSARTIKRARVLLMADQGEHGTAWEDRRVAEAVGCGQRTVEWLRERFVVDGLEAALSLTGWSGITRPSTAVG